MVLPRPCKKFCTLTCQVCRAGHHARTYGLRLPSVLLRTASHLHDVVPGPGERAHDLRALSRWQAASRARQVSWFTSTAHCCLPFFREGFQEAAGENRY